MKNGNGMGAGTGAGVEAGAEAGRRNAWICLGIAALLCAVFFWQLGDSILTGLERSHQGSYELRLERQPLSNAEVKRIVDQTEDSVTAWTQRNGVTVEKKDHSGKAQVPAVLFAGDNQPGFQLNLDRGCVISERLAQELWGTSQVTGERLLLSGQEYVVERVENGSRLWIMARIPEEVLFDALTVRPADPGLGNPIETFQLNQGISSDLSLKIDDVMRLFRSLRGLPLWGLAAAAAVILSVKGRGAWKRGEHQSALTRYGAALGILVCCGFLAGAPFAFPDTLVPTRWSDFEFWERTFDEMGKQWSYLTSMKLYLPDVELRNRGISGVACGAASAVCLYIAFKAALKHRT